MVDVAIIGGGIVGLSTAYYLGRTGAFKEITLLERGELASEASRGNGGALWITNLEEPFTERLAKMSLDLHRELAKTPSFNSEFREVGVIHLIKSESKIHETRELAEKQKAAGFKVEYLDGSAIRKIEPVIGPKIVGGIHCPGDALVNGFLLAKNFGSEAARLGVRIQPFTEVSGFTKKNGRITAIATSRGELSTELVVLAAGPWSSLLGKNLELNIPVKPAKGYMITTEPTVKTLTRSVYDGDVGVLQTPNGSLRAGGTVEFLGFDKTIDSKKSRAVWETAIDLVPKLRELKIAETWAGLRPYSPDDMPIMGFAPNIENLIIATGHFRKGVLLAPITGKLVAELIVNGETSIDISALSPSRFN